MNKYKIQFTTATREIHLNEVIVAAEDEQEAKRKARNSRDYECIDYDFDSEDDDCYDSKIEAIEFIGNEEELMEEANNKANIEFINKFNFFDKLLSKKEIL